MFQWLKELLIKFGFLKAEEEERRAEVKTRDIDLEELNTRDVLIRKLNHKEVYVKAPPAEEPVICPNCGAEVDRLVTCVRCGKTICEECGTYCSGSAAAYEGLATVKEGYYCDECW